MSYYSDQVIKDGATAYWRLGEGSGNTVTDVVGGNNGTISGGVTLGYTGVLTDGNKAASFDGVAGTRIRSINTLPTPTVTLELWVKTTSTSVQRPLCCNRPTGSITFDMSTAGTVFIYSNGTSVTSVNPLINDGNWHHVVATLDGVTTTLYVDGIQKAQGAQTYTATGPFDIGYDANVNVSFLGLIDEVAVYPTVLTPQQITIHYNLARLSFPPSSYPDRVISDGATSYWRLGETSGNTAVDIVGGNNGVISGGVTLNQDAALIDGNKSMLFDGTSGKVQTSWSLTLPINYSVEAWTKPTSLTGQRPLFNNFGGVSAGYFGQSSSRFFLFINSAVPASVSSNTVLVVGTWYHIVWVIEGDQTRVYVNGVLDNTVTQTKPAQSSGLVRIGTNPTNVEWWPGYIDDVAYYPIVLTPSQIANHYGLSKFASPFGTLIEPGVVTSLLQSKIYALSPSIDHITSSGVVEVSSDGIAFNQLVGADTGGTRVSAGFIRSLNASCDLIGKG